MKSNSTNVTNREINMLLADVMFFLIWFCEKRKMDLRSKFPMYRSKSIRAPSSVTVLFDSSISKCCPLCLGFESSSVTIQYSKKRAIQRYTHAYSPMLKDRRNGQGVQ